jgi:hypothetical protein
MGNKKAAATHGLSKKERKALEAREAELSAKLAKAERKAAAKAEAKSKSKADAKRKAHAKAQKKGKVKASGPTESVDSSESTDKHPALKHLDRVAELMATKADKTKSKSERREAEIELEQLRTEGAARIAAKDAAEGKAPVDKTESPLDAETLKIKARVAAKVQARNVGIDIDGVDLHDAAAVKTANKALAKAGIDLVLEVRDIKGARMPDAEPGETEVDYQQRKLKAKNDKATEAKLAKAVAAVGEAVEAVEAQVAEQVETESGREFAVGAPKTDEPLEVGDADEPEAPPIALSDDGKRYLITRPDGTEAPYTRATTYIDGLEHTGALDAWKLRTLLEGIVVDTEATLAERDHAASLVGQVTAAVHERDVATRKLDKADRKGKLEVGERGLVEAKISQAFKAVVDDIAEQALDLGGAHAKANKGTDLHALTEVADEHGIEHIRMLAEAGTITPADLADIEAYVAAMARAGLKVIETEAVVVHDDLGVAGTLDRVVQAPGKLLGRARGAKVVADIKTGNMTYSIGKTSMQVTVYATAKGYEHGKPDRRDLGVLKPTTAKHPGKAPLKKERPLKRDGAEAMALYEARVEAYETALASYNAKRGLGLLIHLPQGEARCTIHLIDLNVGAAGLEVVKAVRAWRNEGKRGIDLKADLVAPPEGGES